jgi:hypothetical protein
VNLLPEKIGGSRKQYMWLGGLVLVLVVVYFINRTPSSSPAVTPATSQTVRSIPSIARAGPVVPEITNGPKLATRSGRKADDFRPSIKLPEGIDITKIDPRLKTELLAKLQGVPLEGGARSVFDYGAPPPPPPPPHVDPIKPTQVAEEQRIKEQKEREEKQKTVKPPPAPIPLKFYGYANRSSGPARQAFFLDGEDIQIKAENDVIRGRYKVIRIGINSAVVEDLQSHDQQTLPLVAEMNT